MTPVARTSGNGRGREIQGDLDHQIGGDAFELLLEGREVAAGRRHESGPGPEQRFTGHGRAFAAGLEFLNIDAVSGEGTGDLTDDAGPILAEEFEGGDRRWGAGLCGWGVRGQADAKLLVDEPAQSLSERGLTLGGDAGTDDAGELATEPCEPAFEPVAVVLGDGGGQEIDEARAVRADDRHDERGVHGGS